MSLEIGIRDHLSLLKSKGNTLTTRQRMDILLALIAEENDAVEIFKNLGLLDTDKINEHVLQHQNGWELARSLMNGIEVMTPNSHELMIKAYGYTRMITPATLNEMIDKVMTQVELQQKEETIMQDHGITVEPIEQEEQMTIGEFI